MENNENQINTLKKGSKLLMDSKRGLFLTNILSKLYEKVLDLLTTENVKINEHQCRGQKGCGTIDSMIMMRAVIDNNRRLNRKHIATLQMHKNILTNCG